MLTWLLLAFLIVLLLGALPRWRYSQSWGYGPSGAVGALAAVLLIVLLFGLL